MTFVREPLISPRLSDDSIRFRVHCAYRRYWSAMLKSGRLVFTRWRLHRLQKRLAKLPLKSAANEIAPANRSKNHTPRPPAFATHHKRINFDGKARRAKAQQLPAPRESSNRQPCQGAAPARKRSTRSRTRRWQAARKR